MKVMVDVPNDDYFTLLKEMEQNPKKLNAIGLAITNGKRLTDIAEDIKSEINKLPTHDTDYVRKDDVLTALAQFVINESDYLYEKRKLNYFKPVGINCKNVDSYYADKIVNEEGVKDSGYKEEDL